MAFTPAFVVTIIRGFLAFPAGGPGVDDAAIEAEEAEVSINRLLLKAGVEVATGVEDAEATVRKEKLQFGDDMKEMAKMAAYCVCTCGAQGQLNLELQRSRGRCSWSICTPADRILL